MSSINEVDFINLVNRGLDGQSISNSLNISLRMVSYYRKKFNLPSAKKCKQINWDEIQLSHNNGLSYRQIKEKYQISISTIQKAIAKGKFKPVEKKQLTIEEKKQQKRIMDRECWMRYYARKKYQTPADLDIKALREFYKNCPEGYEVDHIIPLSKGGSHSLENLQYLPWLENRKKSNKIIAP